MKKTAYHINEVLRIMDQAHRDHATVKLRAWTTDGRAIDYDGWLVSGGSWRGGFHRLTHPQTGEVHTLPDVFIFNFLGLAVFLLARTNTPWLVSAKTATRSDTC